ncbi:MAG: glycoside hydrolase family 3 C-terminal domain-containing protein [Oscillospiraceae bacterium]|jgi:beta-glucosidase|nr:glycoside hydrolase family 3 C-terminal domain-containing protein [Oscillospiraceae bacterium]
MKRLIATLCALVFVIGVCTIPIYAAPEDTTYANYAKVRLVTTSNGLVLAASDDTGVRFIYDQPSGYVFKDLNKNGRIDVYEDWREDIDTRTADLLSQISLTEKFALMAHNGTNVNNGNRMAVSRSIGKGTQADGSSGNLLQRNAEATAFGIPYAFSSDPVHTGVQDTGSNDEGGGGTGYAPVTNISRWPNTLGLANSFSPELHYAFGQVISQEYRNSQIFQQLGPLIDQSTHPVWGRINSAITEDYDLLIDLVQAEVSGMQTTEGEPIKDYGLPEGWGKDSISAMTKHLLGTGSGEFGYEGHTQIGGWLVYPGGGYEKLIGTAADASGFGLFAPHSSKTANAGMTAYGIAVGDDGLGRHNELLGDKRFSLVGGGYSKWLMTDYLREGRNWDGMITSDWGIYGGTGASNHGMQNRFGVNDALRYFVSYMSGMSQTGGTGNVATCQLAYDIGVNGDPARGIPAYGQAYMDAMVDARAGNVIKTIMKCGLFENPYSDPDKADRENGSSELNQIAFDGHHQSIVMIKNHDNLLPIEIRSAKAYAVGSYISGGTSGYGAIGHDNRGITEMAGRFYDTTTDPDEADFAIVMLTGPANGNGTVGQAQTAQFGPYTKTVGREVSLGGYWYHADGSIVQAYEIPNPANGDYKQNMSNIGTTFSNTQIQNVLQLLVDTKAAVGDKPIVLILNYRNAIVPVEFEPLADAIVVGVETAQEAFMNVICGRYEPTGLLAVTFPRSMAHIELSAEDVPDTTPYVDADNNVYQFGFGLNYSGRIVDARTEKYLGLKAINEAKLRSDGTVRVPIELLSYKYGPTGVTATAYYDKADLTLEGFEPAPGFLLVGSGDQFTFANTRAITTNTVIGYAIFKPANTASFDVSKVTFAMDGVAWDIDSNPTMARFNDVEVSSMALGDVNLDGVIDVRDAVLLLQYLAGNTTLSAAQLTAADANLDGNVTVSDVVIIMQMCMA